MAGRSRSTPAQNAAARGAARAVNGSVGRLQLSNGVVLKLKPVPPFAVRQAAVEIKDPPVPVVYIEDKDRTEANPNDPDYLDALKEAQQQRISAVTSLFFMIGTEAVDVPTDMFRPEDDDWIDMLEAVGLPVDRDNKFKRYYQWLAWYVITSEDDISLIVSGVATLSGVREEDVRLAMKDFRG